MTDLNIQSFKSVSPSAKARMEQEREKSDLLPCMGFHQSVAVVEMAYKDSPDELKRKD